MAIQIIEVGGANDTETSTYASANNTAVTFMSLCNHSGSPVTVSIHILIGGTGPGGVSNILIKEIVIPSGDTYILYQGNEKLILGDLDEIAVVLNVGPGAGNVVTVITSFMEV